MAPFGLAQGKLASTG